MAILSNDLAEIEFFLSSNQIDKKDICLVGSVSLAHIGIMLAMPIIIASSSNNREQSIPI